MLAYKNKSSSLLEKTLLSGPVFARAKYAERLEALILELDTETLYSWEYLYFKITGFRPEREMNSAAGGDKLQDDLLLILKRLSEHLPQKTAEAKEEILSIKQAANFFMVSRRTIYRWRKRGLPARIYIFPDGVKRSGIKKSTLYHFQEKNKDLIAKSSSFSRITKKEAKYLKSVFNRLVKSQGCSPTEAALIAGEQTGRSPESIRLLLKKTPDSQLHGRRDVSKPLNNSEKLAIYKSAKAGISVATLAEEYSKSRQTIYRTINAVRGKKLLDKIPEQGKVYLPEKVPQPAESKSKSNLKTTDKKLFFRLNLTKKNISSLRSSLNPGRYVKAESLDKLQESFETKKIIELKLLCKNIDFILGLCINHTGRVTPLDILVTEALKCFFGAVEDFDYLTNRSFTDFLRLRLLKKFALTLPETESEENNKPHGKPEAVEIKKACKELTKTFSSIKAELADGQKKADFYNPDFDMLCEKNLRKAIRSLKRQNLP